ncbi:F0F1 ATP synthase subunit I [Marinobacterium nitratireducens]|uniref:F0F1 ATP synthase subunit I n=1 Tax=Marinobacterium nitratireducens TaxID=518897 RepID=A0A917Z842_9GAMM|nr:ATP synthase subunit I [Marinobacterium nitratireducens]GGO77352.1 F0F1 ATP synthase subunit I [Marinobacterium nitratireducens]
MQNRGDSHRLSTPLGRVLAILLAQAGVALILCAVLLLLTGRVEAWSALLGSLIYLVPNLYFALRTLSRRHGLSGPKVLAAMYIGQIWKMALAILGFSLVFVLVEPISPFSLFGAFILQQILGWIAYARMMPTTGS